MEYKYFQIDAFTDTVFGGNPACVVPLSQWLDDDVLLKITQENAVAETAFFVDLGDKIHLRWFTPELEMDLCGHATLATAHCLKAMLNYPADEIVFTTQSGDLHVKCNNGLYSMNFPARMPVADVLPENIEKSLSIKPQAVYKSRDYVLLYNNPQEIKDLSINRNLFDQINLGTGGVVVTAKGEDCDFVSRFFTPQASILEDPVTGSAHCSLVPFWAKQLNKNQLFAMQLSHRLGKLYCKHLGDRVEISGRAKTFSSGSFCLE